jgi:alpha-L-rhamnosidase
MSLRIRPGSLRCEYRADPLGIGVRHPRLSWTIDSTDPLARGDKQEAYQILAASTRDLLNSNVGDLWDTGKKESSRMAHIPYEGKLLTSAQQVWWKLRVWDGRTITDWSETGNFTMGLLDQADWRAQWITADPASYGSNSLPLFGREFDVDKMPTRALVFVCGLGHFELSVNGQVVGQNVLDPGWTNYSRSCLYVTHDITPLVRPGRNALGVMLGNGMYSVTGGRYKKFKASFGPPRLILQLHLIFEDGGTETIVSDESWRVAPGPITFSCIFGGEDYDARQEHAGWDLPGFSGDGWKKAAITVGPGGMLAPQSAPPVKVMKTFEPVRVSQIAADVAVYDLGRNFSGWAEVTTSGEAGANIKLLPGELLDSDGRVSQKSTGSPISFSYTTGRGKRTWQPKFSYTGFRYIEAQGNITAIEKLTGQFIHSSAAIVGKFSCSKPLFNDIHELINMAILSNLQSVLTDCPHREKLGWLEQTHLMGPAIMFNYDVPLLYSKICQDMREAQQPDGCVPTIAPEYTKFKDQWADFSNSPEWGSAAVINPWLVYQQYGDLEILHDNFEMMRRYVEYLHGREQDGIIEFGLGDWYDIGPGDPGYSKLTSKGLTGTAIYYLDLQLLEKTAILIGETEQAERCAALARRVRRAFGARFFNEKAGHYDRGSQTANGMALAMGLVDRAQEPRVLDSLVRDIRARENHITAGDIGFRFVLDALAGAGRSDVIFDLLSRTDPPSYGAQLRQGATTLTEAWDAKPAKSQNHLMLGHAEIWFYQSLAGIRLDMTRAVPDRLTIQPAIVGDVSWVEASYESILGRIVSCWERQDRKFTLSIEIPCNATGTVYVPTRDPAKLREGGRPIGGGPHVRLIDVRNEAAVLSVDAGKYSFESELDAHQ